MAENKETKESLTKVERIEKEKKRLTNIYKVLPKKEFKTAQKLIDNVAFMVATLEDLMVLINNDDLIKETVNATQVFQKENPAIGSYNKMYANFLKGIQQLNSLLPKDIGSGKTSDDGDEYLEFMKKKK